MKDIKIQRTQSLLQELLNEALTSLDDERIRNLTVTEVVCSRGKYNADIFVLFDTQDKKEQNDLLRLLHKAEGALREYILSSSGWFRCPKLCFKVDESLSRINRLDQIFEKISKK
ncbi:MULTISPECIES: 30S ribosome-binding factor RbfA [unclassified Helicobacter]|uniref:30S ribosome-binding factor RbfA n=1 Tax=unclassified Helicobacter TaxID=2593540 RepID=UPI000CF01359|nr:MULTISPECIES: 30S ribosome-binding factor RbfA [unclassified Helicobacter]